MTISEFKMIFYDEIGANKKDKKKYKLSKDIDE